MSDFHACATSVHEEIIADPDRWESETLPTPKFPGGPLHENRQIVERLEWANCIHCGGTIARPAPEEIAS